MPALDAPPWGWAFLALAVALLAQATLLHALRLRGGHLGLVVLVAVWFATRAGVARGLLFALIAGACEDAVAGNSGAAWTFATPLAVAAGGGALRLLGSANPLVFAAFAGATAILRLVLFRLIAQLQGGSAGFDASALHAALWSALLDAALAAIVLLALPRLRPLRVDAH